MIGIYQLSFYNFIFPNTSPAKDVEGIINSKTRTINIVVNTPAPTNTKIPAPTATNIIIELSTATPTDVPIEIAPTEIVSTEVPELLPTTPACDCSADIYNCSDVPVGCFDYCLQLGVGDVYNLDRDSDGYACEGN